MKIIVVFLCWFKKIVLFVILGRGVFSMHTTIKVLLRNYNFNIRFMDIFLGKRIIFEDDFGVLNL